MRFQRTYGLKWGGLYSRIGPNELYGRLTERGWILFIDGFRIGTAIGEPEARRKLEAAAAAMKRTHTGRLAAPA